MSGSERGSESIPLAGNLKDERAVSDEFSGESTPLQDDQEELLPPEDQSKSAYYDYASEKLISNAESKMFYQRHQLDNKPQDSDSPTSFSRSRTFSLARDVGHGSLSRSVSNASRPSGRSYAVRQKDRTSGLVAALEKLDEPDINGAPATGLGASDGQTIRPEGLEQHTQGPDQDEGVGFALAGSHIVPELKEICTRIKRVLDTRRKYLELSLQRAEDDPRHQTDWEMYPPPPKPVWDEENNRPIPPSSGTNSLENSKVSNLDEPPISPTKKRRKAGHDIGEDFDMTELLPLPGEDERTRFKLDQTSVYQVYDSLESMETDQPIARVPSLRRYYKDLVSFEDWAADGPCKSYAYRQLDILDGKYNLYKLEHNYQETVDCKSG